MVIPRFFTLLPPGTMWYKRAMKSLLHYALLPILTLGVALVSTTLFNPAAAQDTTAAANAPMQHFADTMAQVQTLLEGVSDRESADAAAASLTRLQPAIRAAQQGAEAHLRGKGQQEQAMGAMQMVGSFMGVAGAVKRLEAVNFYGSAELARLFEHVGGEAS